jgi:hypothetical protein
MANIENIINSEDLKIITIHADEGMSGAAIDTIGIWYSPAELVQLQSAITRAINYLNERGVT